MGRAALRRINVYVNPEDLNRVAQELGCRPSDAVRQLIDNYLLALELDEIRLLPGEMVNDEFLRTRRVRLPEVPDTAEVDVVE